MLATSILAAGIGQIVLALGSTLIPRVLDWPRKLALLEPLERRLFWVYAGYILGTNLAFGLLATTLPGELVAGGPLPLAVTGFISLYWISRLVIQFTLFRGVGPSGRWFVVAEVVLVLLFASFAGLFGWAAVVNAGRLVVNAYAVSDAAVCGAVVGLLAVGVVAGFVLTRVSTIRLRPVAWLLPVGMFAAVERLTAAEPAGVRMIAICLALLLGMKGVVGVEARIGGDPPLPPVAWLAFCLGWFGMRPRVFATMPGPPRDGVRDLLVKSLHGLALGIACLGCAWWIGRVLGERSDAFATLAVALPLMIGLSLVVHFALFDLLTAIWRSLGANARKLFRRPIVSCSLTEFWSRRWNLAFSEMTAVAVHRPLKVRLGAGGASVLAFLFSGLLHELAISVPVRAGWGLPMGYFVLHAVAMQVESSRLGRCLEARPWLGRAWTFAWIVLPLPLLFHGPFVAGVVLPIVGR